MNQRKMTRKAYPIFAMLIGSISFFIGGMIAGLISLKTNEGLILIVGAPLGSLLMLSILHKLNKSKVLTVLIRSELGLIAGIFVGFVIGELLAWTIGLMIPSLKDLEQIKAQMLPNIFLLIAADTVFGIFLLDFLYGRKSIPFFALLCGIVSLPFGVLISVPFHITWIHFNENLLFILISFGTSTGFSIGLNEIRNNWRANS